MKNSKSNNTKLHKKKKTTTNNRIKKSKVVSLSKKRDIRKEERTTMAVIGITMFFFTLSMGGSIISLLTRDQIPTMVVELGSVDIPEIQQGIIIRSETVYRSNSSGEVNFEVEQHQRVRKGTLIATIRNTQNILPLEEEREELSRTILGMQSQRGSISALAYEANQVNNMAQATINNNIYRLLGTDVSIMNDLYEDLSSYVLLRNEILLTENRGSLEYYVTRNMENEALIASNITNITANESGIVSYIVDGMEEVLSIENMENLTVEQTRMTVNYESIEIPKHTRNNENLFKIINSNEWFIASYVPNELVENWNQNSSVTIYIERKGEFKPMGVTVHNIRRGEEETFIILRSRSYMLEHINERGVNFKTVSSEHRGLLIAESSLATRIFIIVPKSFINISEEGVHTVVKKENENLAVVNITPRTIRSVETDENYIYILQDFNNLALGDVVLSQDGLNTEYTIHRVITDTGVFIVNNGIATFTSIDKEGMVVDNNGNIILSVERNSGRGGLNVFDRIVSDTFNYFIEEEQKVF